MHRQYRRDVRRDRDGHLGDRQIHRRHGRGHRRRPGDALREAHAAVPGVPGLHRAAHRRDAGPAVGHRDAERRPDQSPASS